MVNARQVLWVLICLIGCAIGFVQLKRTSSLNKPRLLSIGSTLRVPASNIHDSLTTDEQAQHLYPHSQPTSTLQQTQRSSLLSDRTLIEYGAMGTRKLMEWNKSSNSFTYHSESEFNLKHALHGHFFPSGELLTEDYYRYAAWRATQRLVSATNSVFGTQALLLALGFKKHPIGKNYIIHCLEL